MPSLWNKTAFLYTKINTLDKAYKCDYNNIVHLGNIIIVVRVRYMEFIPFDFSRKDIFGNEILSVLPDHLVLKQRRLELNLTQQDVADKAGILLRQYHRLEKGERSITSTSPRIFLSVCAVLKLDPYGFFPDIEQRMTVKVIEPTVKTSKYIPFVEFKDLMCKVPAGKVVTRKRIEEYFCCKYNVEVVAIDERHFLLDQIEKKYPYWREVGNNGTLYMTTRFHSRDIQEKLLTEDGVEIIEWGENNRSRRVKDFKERLFDLKLLLD